MRHETLRPHPPLAGITPADDIPLRHRIRVPNALGNVFQIRLFGNAPLPREPSRRLLRDLRVIRQTFYFQQSSNPFLHP